jgi:hypothetical protein
MIHISFNSCHTNKHYVDYLCDIFPCLSYVEYVYVIKIKYVVYLCDIY